MSSDGDLLSVDEMSEIPSGNRAGGSKGGSKGVNLFLARQKLIADMMEQEEEEQQGHTETPTAGGSAQRNQYISTSNRPINHPAPTVSSSADHSGQHPSVGAEVEIPTSSESAAGGKSKGVNLFLARQKQIADMMKAEEEAERAAEEEKKRAEEERLKQEAKERKLAEEKRKHDELKRIEQEKLLESQRAAAARAAKFKPPKTKQTTAAGPEPELSWVKKSADSSNSIVDLHISDSDDELSEKPCLKVEERPSKNDKLLVDANRNDIDTTDCNGISHLINAPILNLPKSQPPTVTLLQKSRVVPLHSPDTSANNTDCDMHKIRECLASQSGFISMHAGAIPKGALYIGANERIVGGLKQSDTYILVSPALAAAEEDNSNSHAHKMSNSSHTISGGDDSETIEVVTLQENPTSSTSSDSTLIGATIQRDGVKSLPKVPQKPRKQEAERARKMYSERYGHTNRSQDHSQDVEDSNACNHRSQSEVSVVETMTEEVCSEARTSNTASHAGRTTGHENTEDTKVIRSETTACSPDNIPRDYADDDTELSITTTTSLESDNPFTRPAGAPSPPNSPSLLSPKLLYKEIQKGGEIPLSGLRKPAPITPPPRDIERVVPEPVAGYDRAPAPLPREQRDHIDAKRKELLLKLERDGKKKKAKEEEAERKSRRHSDNFTIKDKSPIPHDRYEQNCFPGSPRSPARSSISLSSPRSLTDFELAPIKARLLYAFKAQHPRELTADKGDIIHIIKRVDSNWYEARIGTCVGIVPATYVQIYKDPSLSPPPVRPAPPRLLEGSGVAKYSFNPQSLVELALKKGDQVVLLRRVDSNWYEGRSLSSNKSGIFPVTYIQVIREPDTVAMPLPTSSPAVLRTQSVPNGSNKRQRSMSSPQRVLVSPQIRTLSSSYNSSPSEFLLSINTADSCSNTKGDILKAGVGRSHSTGLDMPSYKSLYNYTPRNGDELELMEGDVVHVIEKCNDGWYVGTSGRTGLFGTFPGNYVTPV